MANGHVEIHDPLTNGPKSSVVNSVASGGGGDADDDSGMEDTVEFRIMMAYATRRRGGPRGSVDLNGTASPQLPLNDSDSTAMTLDKKKKKKKKKRGKGMKGLKRLFSCAKPQTSDEEESEPPSDALLFRIFPQECGGREEEGEEEELEVDELEEAAARQLSEIANDIPFVPSDLQTDSPDNVERLIGLLLREAGDRLNEQELRDASWAREIFWNYSFFNSVITELLTRMGLRSSEPVSLGAQASPTTQMAVTCEATRRLTALDTIPANRLFGYGARFLNDNYSSWVQEQGGYEVVFKNEDEDEDEVH